MTETKQTPLELQVLVVGAGFAGLYQLHKARSLGLKAHALEKGSDVGGTWYWNRYPGCRCDIPSRAYSVSYLPDLDQEWTWPEMFGAQSDILTYAQHIATRLDLYPDISFNTSVVSATWDDKAKRWIVKTDRGHTIATQFLVMATGTLSVERKPDVPGLDVFKGRWFHTGRWPHEPVDFKGRRVAVVGTGSTGIQVIPAIADDVSELVVFQRTPKFTVPLANRAHTEQEIAEAKAVYPEFRLACRRADFGFAVNYPDIVLTEMQVTERETLLNELWYAGRYPSFFVGYADHLGMNNRAVNDILSDFARKKIREIVKDPETAETLTPYGYPMGINRLCRDKGYYETFNRPHVKLVDTRKEAIVELVAEGIRTEKATYAVDDIIFATGYDALTGALTSIDIKGRKGTTIRDEWKNGPHSYLGVAIPDFPNLFIVTGPGSPSVLGNVIVAGERNIDFISALLEHMTRENLKTAEATSEADADWMEQVHAASQSSLYRDAHKANAWYTGKNVPGKKVVFMPYSGGLGRYVAICEGIAKDGFRGFNFSS